MYRRKGRAGATRCEVSRDLALERYNKGQQEKFRLLEHQNLQVARQRVAFDERETAQNVR